MMGREKLGREREGWGGDGGEEQEYDEGCEGCEGCEGQDLSGSAATRPGAPSQPSWEVIDGQASAGQASAGQARQTPGWRGRDGRRRLTRTGRSKRPAGR